MSSPEDPEEDSEDAANIDPSDDTDSSNVKDVNTKLDTGHGSAASDTRYGGNTAKTVGVGTGDISQSIPLAAFTAIAVLLMLTALLRKTKVSDR